MDVFDFNWTDELPEVTVNTVYKIDAGIKFARANGVGPQTIVVAAKALNGQKPCDRI